MDSNRFYKLNNPKDRQYTSLYINLDDISSVQYPNESLNVGIVTTKTGKEHYVQKEELDKIIKLLNIIHVPEFNMQVKLNLDNFEYTKYQIE